MGGVLIREYVWFNGAPIAVIEGGVIYLVRSDWTRAAGLRDDDLRDRRVAGEPGPPLARRAFGGKTVHRSVF